MLNFTQIEEYKEFTNSIREDKKLSKFEYRVSVFDDYSFFPKLRKPIKEIRFGNEDHDRGDKVMINIYKDKIDLHCLPEGAQHHVVTLNTDNDKTLEDCLFLIFDEWKNYYLK
ncbi:hypothetical protein [Alkalihalobacillus trypoxylicola]|uniref:Uncharacterized protein n=1 Tax=Alkalihalobacillus trypoxylicola TaxID=519424 RepID=A0A162D5J4_9BACI|nr:hypothetical protein [Alkalihalobacillus trypoxylicola]KYG28187.1 hypothetical protein AZF04_09805 [Alkalihalobacillus trypoxylicola]